MNPVRPRSQSRVLRLLVFACFFNFSGVNNGYTSLASVSPLNAGQSVSALGALIKSFTFFLAPQKFFSSMSRSRRFVAALSIGAEKSVKASVRRGGHRVKSARARFSARMERRVQPAEMSRAESALPAASGTFNHLQQAGLSAIHTEYVKEKETWRQQKEEWSKEIWNGLSFHASSRWERFDLNAPRTVSAVFSPEKVWDDNRRLIQVLRNLSYPDHARLHYAVAACLIDHPGLRDRGLFLPAAAEGGRA